MQTVNWPRRVDELWKWLTPFRHYNCVHVEDIIQFLLFNMKFIKHDKNVKCQRPFLEFRLLFFIDAMMDYGFVSFSRICKNNVNPIYCVKWRTPVYHFKTQKTLFSRFHKPLLLVYSILKCFKRHNKITELSIIINTIHVNCDFEIISIKLFLFPILAASTTSSGIHGFRHIKELSRFLF